MSNKKVCGIDLGTGFSAVAVIENGKSKVIENAEGKKTTPSVVFLKEGEDRKIGDAAKRGMIMNPKNTVSFIKRFMGAEYSDADVQKMLKQVTYEVINKNSKPYVKIDNKEYSPVEISSMILAKMKKTAEDYYGEEVTDAVITCPAWFNDTQRQATKAAGEAIGLNVLRIINEPTAAILSSDIDVKNNDKVILVNDLGCGTEDVSICEVSDGMVEVRASYGDVFLGGQNYDDAVANWLVDEFKSDTGIDLKKDNMAWARIIEAAEKAKCELSSTTQTEINLPYITVADGVPQMLIKTLTRAKFEQLTYDLTQKVVTCAKEAIKKAGKTYKDIDEILLVGGSSRIPSVQDALAKEIGAPLNKTANFDEAVALGAAIQANTLAGNSDDSVLLLDVTPISLGIETMGEVMTKLVEANTTIPTKKTQVFSTAVDNQPGVQIVVLQGERPMSRDNKVIGTFNLDGIAPAPKGVPQIEVEFNIDANGILSVSATDKATGKEQHITITGGNSLSQEEIDRIKADAEKYKEEDTKKQEEIKKVNEAEGLSYSIEQTLKDEKFADKFTEDEKKSINEKNDALKEALKDRSNVDAITTAKDELQKVYEPIITRIYKESNPQSADAQSNAQSNPFNAGFTGSMFGMDDMFNGNAPKTGTNPTNTEYTESK